MGIYFVKWPRCFDLQWGKRGACERIRPALLRARRGVQLGGRDYRDFDAGTHNCKRCERLLQQALVSGPYEVGMDLVFAGQLG